MDKTTFIVYSMCGFDNKVFARCTTYEKAQKAVELLEEEGFEDMVDILQEETKIDVIEIDGKAIEL